MNILYDDTPLGKAPPHDAAVCGIDQESSCAACRAACWPGDELWQRQALERLADDQAVIRYRLPKSPERFRGSERANHIRALLSFFKTIIADPEFRGVVKFVLNKVLEGGEA